jgi:hypothetical protein
MRKKHRKSEFVVCVKNRGYKAALELRKIYQSLPDTEANAHDLVRVVDESGEDYLYPASFFIPIQVPAPVERALSA